MTGSSRAEFGSVSERLTLGHFPAFIRRLVSERRAFRFTISQYVNDKYEVPLH